MLKIPIQMCLAIAVLMGFCYGPGAARADDVRAYPCRITCTTGMVTDIVRNVAGAKADVQGIIGEGADPHLYTATRGDVVKLLRADDATRSARCTGRRLADAPGAEDAP